jgi:FtsP/CotA-like multicopper oxidase with cupredoxin domain
MVFNQVFYNKEILELPDFGTLMAETDPPSGTTINGVVKPVIPIKKGEVQRWRMVHSGYRTLLGLAFDKRIQVREIAVDGLMFDSPVALRSAHMAPGNRMDILVHIPKNASASPGDTIPIYSTTYIADCEYFPDSAKCDNNNSKQEVICYLIVEKGELDMQFPTQLPGHKHQPITESEIINRNKPRQTDFSIVPAKPGTTGKTLFLVDGAEFHHDTISHRPLVGTAEQWNIKSSFSFHPYHIHVNPFQVVEYRGAKLKRPMWKDVILVGVYNGNSDKVAARVYTRYEEYTGDFVMHCHILHHEDQGMMQRIRIVGKKEDADK